MNGVSVILTTYNGVTRGYLGLAIESVLRQTSESFELIIVDDGSTDATPQFCRQFLGDPRVSYCRQENQGPASARNSGIRSARGRYITFLDDDDFYEPNMVESLYKAITNRTETNTGMLYCRTRHIDSRGKTLKTPLYEGTAPVYETLFYGNVLSTPAVIIDKKVFDTVGTFREHLRYSEDYDLWFRISNSFGVYPLDELLVNIRVHDCQLSKHPRQMEFFHSLVLHQAIEAAPPKLAMLSESYYYSFYISYMKIYLGMNCLKDFQRMLLSAKVYGPIPLKWQIKYWLSHSPSLFFFLQKRAALTFSKANMVPKKACAS